MDNTQELKSIVFIDEGSFACNNLDACKYKERSLSYAVGVDIPTPTVDPEEVFKECCYVHNVFADENSSDDFKNDYSSFYHQRQLSNENASFKLIHINTGDEFDLVDSTYGSFYGFGSFSENTNLTGFRLEWKKVLEDIGEGSFKVVKSISKIGITVDFNSLVYTLSQFNEKRANKTARIDVVLNGLMEKDKTDFTGIGWKDSIRVPGFFGRREFQFEEDFLIDRTFEKRQISMKQTNEYKFQTNSVPNCVTNPIIDLFLFADDIYMNDYNLNNHSYDYKKFSVKFQGNENTDYTSTSRKARLNLIFNDKFENNLKRNYR